MKVIFTDIDGVLKPFDALKLGLFEFSKECVANYNKIFEAVPDLKIVVSSAWRLEEFYENKRIARMQEIFKRNGVIGEVIDVTGEYERPKFGSYDATKFRGLEVEQWLKLHFEVDVYHILDDDDLGFSDIFLPTHFLITDSYKGLTTEEASVIIKRVE